MDKHLGSLRKEPIEWQNEREYLKEMIQYNMPYVYSKIWE